MILLLDSSTPVCRLELIDSELRHQSEWQADRELARGLLGFLETELKKAGGAFEDLEGIGVYRGPGSFTGLRIGLTVLNTLADALRIPIVSETGDNWQRRATERLRSGEDEKIALPLYGSEAHITAPRK